MKEDLQMQIPRLMKQVPTEWITTQWQFISTLLLFSLLIIQDYSGVGDKAYAKLALERDSSLVSRIRSHARGALQRDLESEEVQILDQQTRVIERPSYKRYFHTTLKYKAQDTRGNQIIEEQCFIYSKTGRQANVCQCD